MTDSYVHIFENKTWYFLSIYYSRDKWSELLSQITHFYDMRKGQFSDCLVSLSDDRGDHIRLTLVSPNCTENYQNEIAVFFQSYIDKNPSHSTQSTPYGQVLWGNYPNNTLTWDKFRIWEHTDRYICFHQKTFRLATQLLENDFSDTNILSGVLYLAAKGLSCIEPDMRNNALSDALNEVSEKIGNHKSFESTLQSIIDNTDEYAICETIESYLGENVTEYSPELVEWLAEIKNVKDLGLRNFCSMICNMLGLSGLCSVLILKLLDVWQKSSLSTAN
jgi:hypothetical protein